MPEDMRGLIQLRDENAALRTILSRIHYAELPTVYPPVSQLVFASAVAITPSDADVFAYLVVMKLVLALFDVATLFVVFGLLTVSRQHLGWAVAYGWCPLVIKEVSNTGHLDSIAIFFTTLALYLAMRALAEGTRRRGRRVEAILSAVVLALGIGAKLYPVVLAPMLFWIWSRTVGWRWATISFAACALISVVILCPMIPVKDREAPTGVANASADDSLPPPIDASRIVPQDPSRGLKTFLRRWEMNDFLFLLVVENLRPSAELEPSQRPWFSCVPDPWRLSLLAPFSDRLAMDLGRGAFLLARLLTTSIFVVIGSILVWKTRRSTEPAMWLEVAFLTLAWFWLLSPTQNPWYWLWTLPLLPFAKSRAWLAVSGLALIYYLRFWFIYHHPDPPVFGTAYNGVLMFDYVFTWIEFGPWFLWLAIETYSSRRRHRRIVAQSVRHLTMNSEVAC